MQRHSAHAESIALVARRLAKLKTEFVFTGGVIVKFSGGSGVHDTSLLQSTLQSFCRLRCKSLPYKSVCNDCRKVALKDLAKDQCIPQEIEGFTTDVIEESRLCMSEITEKPKSLSTDDMRMYRPLKGVSLINRVTEVKTERMLQD